MRKHKYYDFAYLKGKTMDRKGMGMELALLVLLVVFACSTLLVSSALFGKSNLQTQEQELRRQLTLDQLAECILAEGTPADEAKLADYAAFRKVDDGWVNVLDRDGVTFAPEEIGEDVVLVITDLSGTPLLTVAQDADHKITQWSYH